MNAKLLAEWGLRGGENRTILPVLTAIGLLNSRREPTDLYSEFLNRKQGPSALGGAVRRLYAPLFQTLAFPHHESNETLRQLFSRYSGCTPSGIEDQIRTFKALCDYAHFDHAAAAGPISAGSPAPDNRAVRTTQADASDHRTGIAVDVHIHLPAGARREEYRDILEELVQVLLRLPR